MRDPILSVIIADAEGRSLDVYRDSEGYWTIGDGHLVSTDKTITEAHARELCNAPWTPEQCEATRDAEIDAHWAQLCARWPWAASLPDWPRRGVVDMAYQLGVSGVAGFPHMLLALKAGDWATAEAEALDSDGTPTAPGWHRQTPKRCEATAAMLGNRVETG